MSEPKVTDLDEIAQTDSRSAWLMTNADLFTLVLVFFVLLFALHGTVEAEFTQGRIVLRVEGKEGAEQKSFNPLELQVIISLHCFGIITARCSL